LDDANNGEQPRTFDIKWRLDAIHCRQVGVELRNRLFRDIRADRPHEDRQSEENGVHRLVRAAHRRTLCALKCQSGGVHEETLLRDGPRLEHVHRVRRVRALIQNCGALPRCVLAVHLHRQEEARLDQKGWFSGEGSLTLTSPLFRRIDSYREIRQIRCGQEKPTLSRRLCRNLGQWVERTWTRNGRFKQIMGRKEKIILKLLILFGVDWWFVNNF